MSKLRIPCQDTEQAPDIYYFSSPESKTPRNSSDIFLSLGLCQTDFMFLRIWWVCFCRYTHVMTSTSAAQNGAEVYGKFGDIHRLPQSWFLVAIMSSKPSTRDFTVNVACEERPAQR